MFACKVDGFLIVIFSSIFIGLSVGITLSEFFRKKKFYDVLISNVDKLDKAYLVLETLECPNFYEGKLLYQTLYEINKSMNENVHSLKRQVADFKEYIEMWIHEVKIPISSLMLLAHNHKDKYDKKSIQIMMRIEDYVEQVLYYVRAENVEKDYFIKKTLLSKVVSNVALKNKDDLLENEIEFLADNLNIYVLSDSKWLEFILNQVINNSIKYKDKGKKSYIKIWAEESESKTKLYIEDNGLGIDSNDLPRVFDKAFTGKNGRMHSKSTGMGLFIVKSLASKLGHVIEIESESGEYTKVVLSFSKNNFYDVVK